MDPASRLDTLAVHAGMPSPRPGGAVAIPLYLSSSYDPGDAGSYDDLRYPRLNNTPTQLAAAARVAALEGAEAGLITASGMAAITTATLEALGEGGHLIAQDTLYSGTFKFFAHELSRFGCAVDFVDATRPETWAAALRPNTRAFYTEALTNPLIQVADHQAVAAFARAHGLLAMIDATFATPVVFRPLAAGYDLVLHSATKYLNGHSDLVAGAVAGSEALVGRVRGRLNLLGGSLDPFGCYMLARGLSTLGLRVRQQGANALALARLLEGHPAVRRVHHPGLEASPHHERAKASFTGFGAMLSFETHSAEAAARFVTRLRLAVRALSLGGVETLVTRPAATTHMGLSPEERARQGISDALIRVSVGIEDIADLSADFTQALEGL
ncbi:MAG: PLP-dependent transferase [Alphaproteobacteria bacterium]|nr:PLP-dependent transferase [Alphaproteobacteria bacterium]